MLQQKLHDLAVINIENKILHKVDITNLVKSFTSYHCKYLKKCFIFNINQVVSYVTFFCKIRRLRFLSCKWAP